MISELIAADEQVIRDLANQRWLADGDLRDLKARMRVGRYAPPPPFSEPGLVPVTWSVLANRIASYNAYVRLWNAQETDLHLPTSPQWWDGEEIFDAEHLNHLVLARPSDPKEIIISLRAWHRYYPGWSHCRHEVHIEQIEWAGQGPNRHQ